MTRAYSTDLRERVVAAVRSGSTVRAVAERFGVAVSSVVKWSQLERRTGGVAPGRTGGHRKKVLAPHHDWLMARVEACSEVTLITLRDELRAKGVQVSHDTVWRYLRGVGFSFKKKRAGQRAGSARRSAQAGEVAAVSGRGGPAAPGLH
jgi:transposase